MGAAAVPLLITALGTGAQVWNTNRTLSRQDDDAAAGIRRQSEIQRRADGRVNEEVNRLETSTAADERATRTSEFMAALRNARSRTEGGLEGVGMGQDFNAAAAAAKGDLAQRGTTAANQLATVDAAGLQRMGEGFGYGRLATEISALTRESQGQQFLTDLAVRNRRNNPWVDAAGSLAQGVGMGMATNAGAGGGSSGVPVPTNDQLIWAMRYGSGGGT